jgi:hypothetical protein
MGTGLWIAIAAIASFVRGIELEEDGNERTNF